MKRIKLFENFDVNEAGEWSTGMDRQKVLSMSKDEIDADDQASWIAKLDSQIQELCDQGIEIEIDDIKGYDMRQGPYATVRIKGKQGTWDIWTAEDDTLFIENWPEGNNNRGFVGTIDEIVNLLK